MSNAVAKRGATQEPRTPSSSDFDSDVKPYLGRSKPQDDDEYHEGDDEEESKPSPSKKRRGGEGNGKSPKSPRKERAMWTDEEDKIFLSLVEKTLNNALWQEVKADGRLVHRRPNGIKAHSTSMMNKLRKA